MEILEIRLGEGEMSNKKYKIVKVIVNSPIMLIGACQQFGHCKIIKNSIYVATTNTLKEIREELDNICTVGYKAIIIREYLPEVMDWIRELQTQDLEIQLLKKMISTVKM